MDAGRGRTQCQAQSARVENVKLCSFYACLGGKKFYSRRASCASAEGSIETGVWRLRKLPCRQTARRLWPVVGHCVSALFITL